MKTPIDSPGVPEIISKQQPSTSYTSPTLELAFGTVMVNCTVLVQQSSTKTSVKVCPGDTVGVGVCVGVFVIVGVTVGVFV